MASAPEQRFVFDDVADEYAAARPAYPSALFDDLIRIAGLRAESRVLELGCGPGTATVGLLHRGFELVCLEPGARLAALARARTAGTTTTVIESTFEHYPLPAEPFDLVFAAQSFHWIDPALRFVKCAQALRAGGTLALFAHRWLRSDDALRARLDRCYAELAPISSPDTDAKGWQSFAAAFEQTELFEVIAGDSYPARLTYRTQDYLTLLQTHSNDRMLPAPVRDRLLEAIGRVIDDVGGSIAIDDEVGFCCGRKR